MLVAKGGRQQDRRQPAPGGRQYGVCAESVLAGHAAAMGRQQQEAATAWEKVAAR